MRGVLCGRYAAFVRGRLFPVAEDWCEWRQHPPLAGTVLVRVAVSGGGRLVLSGLRIDGALSAGLLRAIPLGKIEATANAQFAGDSDLGFEQAVATSPRPRPMSPPAAGTAGWDTVGPTAAVLRAEPAAHRRTRGRPDTFYQEIAGVYLAYSQRSTGPARDIAGQRGVPVSTAHRWVKEARRRGFLPPGHPGKTG